jgi:hypothetical protein
MHELGHTLGLTHGGALDESGANCKPNYMSIMNYNHFEIESLVGPPIIDYSPARKSDGSRGLAPLPDLDEKHLDETMVLDPSDAEHLIVFVNGKNQDRMSPVGAPVDWNGDGDALDTDVAVNIDTDGADGFPAGGHNTFLRTQPDPLPGYNDWFNISYRSSSSASRPMLPVSRSRSPRTTRSSGSVRS